MLALLYISVNIARASDVGGAGEPAVATFRKESAMNRVAKLLGAALLVGVLAPLTATAQERGRTDGPEGSEYGKGGYSAARAQGPLTLRLEWGAGVTPDVSELNDGPPLYVGATATFWTEEWLGLDLSGAYLFDGQRFNLVAGPRFQTWGYRVRFYAALKAGIINVPDEELRSDDGSIRFGLVPEVGTDFVVDDREHVSVGLAYSPDIPIGGGEVSHRIGVNVGYRF